jgi:Zn-dependent protease
VNEIDLLQTVLIYALPVLFAITLHEAAHGYAAHRLGDNTAWALGRVSLNPMQHIHPVGTLLLPLLLYFATGGRMLFGYAKPVPVQFGRLRHPKRDMVWVALAGPMMNLLQAVIWSALAIFLEMSGVTEPFFLAMCQAGKLVNVTLFAFNLFPVLPLDGGRILAGLLPWRYSLWLAKLEPYGFFIVMGLVLLGILNDIWMQPLMMLSSYCVDALVSPLQWLYK